MSKTHVDATAARAPAKLDSGSNQGPHQGTIPHYYEGRCSAVTFLVSMILFIMLLFFLVGTCSLHVPWHETTTIFCPTRPQSPTQLVTESAEYEKTEHAAEGKTAQQVNQTGQEEQVVPVPAHSSARPVPPVLDTAPPKAPQAKRTRRYDLQASCRGLPSGYHLALPNSSVSDRIALREVANDRPNVSYSHEYLQFVATIESALVHEPVELSNEFDCVVYTAFIGNYEAKLKMYAPQTRKCHWVVLADHTNLAGDGWKVRPIPRGVLNLPFRSGRHRGYFLAKYVKMLPFLFLPQHIRWAIYIDATFSVTNATFAERAIETISSQEVPVAFRRHMQLNSTEIELEKSVARYRGVGTADLLIKQYLAHVAEGMCEKWFLPDPEQMSVARLTRALRIAFCYLNADGDAIAERLARQFLFSDNDMVNRRYPCRSAPPEDSALPRLPAEILKGLPKAGPKVPLYDCSMIVFDLQLPEQAALAFAREFLLQWFRDSSLTGKDQLPLIMLLWRTPGFFPGLMGEEFRSFGGPMLLKSAHGQ